MIGSDYPHSAGVRPNATGGTSEAAAAFVTPHIRGMCADVLSALEAGPASPEELTELASPPAGARFCSPACARAALSFPGWGWSATAARGA